MNRREDQQASATKGGRSLGTELCQRTRKRAMARRNKYKEIRAKALEKANATRLNKPVILATPKKTIPALTKGFRDLRSLVNEEKELRFEQDKELTRLEKSAACSTLKAEALADELASTSDELELARIALGDAKTLSDRAEMFRKSLKARMSKINRLERSKKMKEEEIIRTQSGVDQLIRKHTDTITKERGAAKDLEEQVCMLESELARTRLDLQEALQNAKSVQDSYESHVKELEDIINEMRAEEEKLTGKLNEFHKYFNDLSRSFSNLKARLRRTQKEKIKLQEFKDLVWRTSQFKENRIYKPQVRCLVRQMAIRSCPLKNIGAILNCFYQLFLHPLIGPPEENEKITMDSRTVRRFVEEGKIAAELQMIVEIMRSPAFTSSGDGTTHQSLNYESAHINLHAPSLYSPENVEELQPKIRRAEVRLAANHKAATQMAGDLAYMEHIIDHYHRSPMVAVKESVNRPVNLPNLFTKWAGTHGDHAEDQKAKHRMLGEKKKEQVDIAIGWDELESFPNEKRGHILDDIQQAAIVSSGGWEAWESMDAVEQQKHYESILENALKALAINKRLNMDVFELRKITSFAWVGCEMHKDLNTVKGGYNAMKEAWKETNMAPCPLANRDNAVIFEAANRGQLDARALEHAAVATAGGAVKLGELAGALLNHRDDKKGFHDQFKDYGRLILNKTITFPDTSNTRFGSNIRASAELLSRSGFYLSFLENVRNGKEKRNLNNLEENVRKGLLDVPTRIEMAVLTAYGETVSYPYIAIVRGEGLETQNALDMGAFHLKVTQHIIKLINDPDLALSAAAEPEQAILGAYTHWERPEAMAAVHALAYEYPMVRKMFVTFLEGAEKTWRRFLSEFAPDGEVEQLTADEKRIIWMPTTNDANEGALGEWRSFSRRYPCGSLGLFNALSTYRHNNTQDFMDNVLCSEEDQVFLREEARDRLDQKLDVKKRKLVAEERVAEAETRRLKGESNAARKRLRTEHLDSLELVTDRDTLAAMTVAELRDQLAKYKVIDKQTKENTYVRRKDELLRVVVEAAARYMHSGCGQPSGSAD